MDPTLICKALVLAEKILTPESRPLVAISLVTLATIGALFETKILPP